MNELNKIFRVSKLTTLPRTTSWSSVRTRTMLGFLAASVTRLKYRIKRVACMFVNVQAAFVFET